MRAGLVGTGPWATSVHAPTLAEEDGIELVGVWGRTRDRREEIAAANRTRAYDDLDRLVRDVDLLAFAVPPAAQAELVARVARHGRALLLEKPVATSVEDAERIVAAVEGSPSLVFTARLFDGDRARWLAETATRRPVHAEADCITGSLVRGDFTGSPWRHRFGALWDLGPHVLSQLEALLGPVTAVAVDSAASAGETRLRLEHERGTSITRVSGHARPEQVLDEVRATSGDGRVERSPAGGDMRSAYRRALRELREPGGEPLRAGASVGAGLRAVRVLSAAQELIDGRRFRLTVTV
jgi:predicted dehydrogenase